MRKVLIDTNICYEIFLKDSSAKKSHSRVAAEYDFAVNLQIIAELIALCRARKKDWLVFEILDPLLRGNIFEIEELTVRDVQRATTILKKYKDKHLSFTDCLILAQAANYNCFVWTKDQEMKLTKECEFFEPG